MYISKNLNYLRKQSELSYRKLGERISVPHVVLERIEKGITRDPQISTVQKICSYFKITIDDFVNNNLTT